MQLNYFRTIIFAKISRLVQLNLYLGHLRRFILKTSLLCKSQNLFVYNYTRVISRPTFTSWPYPARHSHHGHIPLDILIAAIFHPAPSSWPYSARHPHHGHIPPGILIIAIFRPASSYRPYRGLVAACHPHHGLAAGHRSTGMRWLVGCIPKETLHCCPVTRDVFSNMPVLIQDRQGIAQCAPY